MADNVTSLADRIKALDDLKRQPVEVPEWADALDGAQLYVRELSGADQVAMAKLAGDFDIAVFVVLRCLVDGSGSRVFADADADAVRDKNAAVILRIAGAAAEVSGLSTAAVDDAIKN